MSALTKSLVALDACREAVEWANIHPDLAAAWAACERGDWMLWLIGKTINQEPEHDDRKRLVFAACRCARLALPHTKDPRVLACIETCERWSRGEATIQELYKADAFAASDAYAAAFAASAAFAAASAAYAAASAASDSFAAFAAAFAASDAGYAAYAAADYAAAARLECYRDCAAIVRGLYPHPPVLP